MITPDPVLMTNESGRTFEFELGRNEKIKKAHSDSVDGLPTPAVDPNASTEAIEEFEDKWITYRFK